LPQNAIYLISVLLCTNLKTNFVLIDLEYIPFIMILCVFFYCIGFKFHKNMYTLGMKVKKEVVSVTVMHWHLVEKVESGHGLFQSIA
jgi:hypothetical protein